jgi:ketosteroid isomerase-like protein
MRILLPLAASAAIAACSRPAPADRDQPAGEQVRQVVATVDSAWNAKDSGAVSRWLSPQYRYFSSRGRVVAREELLRDLVAPHYVLEYAERSELEVAVDGPTAVVSSRWRGRGTWLSTQFVDDQRCSLTLTQTGAGWRLLSEHCTQIAP